MSTFFNLVYNYRPAYNDGGGTSYLTGTVYLTAHDDDGNPVNGNSAVVTVAFTNGNLTTNHDFLMRGQSMPVYDGLISRSLNNSILELVTFSIITIAQAGDSLPLSCDAAISSVSINKKESQSGAADGLVTVNASSSYGPIQYSLNNTEFQASPTFIGLSGGGHTAYVIDGNGCTASFAFNLGTTQNLLVSDPSVALGGGNISRWSAAFNPVMFTYQRKDLDVTNITADPNSTGTLLTVNGYTGNIAPGDPVYINAGAYNGVYKTVLIRDNGLVIDPPFISNGSITGFMNSNTLRRYYKIATQVTYRDKVSGSSQTIISNNHPDKAGLVRADLSSFLQSLLRADDDSDYTQTNYRDTNLSASYEIAYQESWSEPASSISQNEVDHQSDWITVSTPFYVTYTAKQLGEQYGCNMAAFVPFKTVADPTRLARWVTDFAEPAYSIGYPFDIGFIYSEDLTGLNLYYELLMLDANRKPLFGTPETVYLLNDDHSYLLGQDDGRFIISKYGAINHLTPNQLGLNRLLIADEFPREAYYFNLTLKYDDADDIAHAVTQTQTVRIDDAVDDRSVYLRWIGLTGQETQSRINDIRLKVLEDRVALLQKQVDDVQNSHLPYSKP